MLFTSQLQDEANSSNSTKSYLRFSQLFKQTSFLTLPADSKARFLFTIL